MLHDLLPGVPLKISKFCLYFIPFWLSWPSFKASMSYIVYYAHKFDLVIKMYRVFTFKYTCEPSTLNKVSRYSGKSRVFRVNFFPIFRGFYQNFGHFSGSKFLLTHKLNLLHHYFPVSDD